MSAEEILKLICEAFPEGIDLEVEAECYEKTHIAKNIHFKIITPDPSLALDFLFKAQQKTTPHISNRSYLRGLIKTLIKRSKEKAEKAEPIEKIEKKEVKRTKQVKKQSTARKLSFLSDAKNEKNDSLLNKSVLDESVNRRGKENQPPSILNNISFFNSSSSTTKEKEVTASPPKSPTKVDAVISMLASPTPFPTPPSLPRVTKKR
jgi:hypothetical protein